MPRRRDGSPDAHNNTNGRRSGGRRSPGESSPTLTQSQRRHTSARSPTGRRSPAPNLGPRVPAPPALASEVHATHGMGKRSRDTDTADDAPDGDNADLRGSDEEEDSPIGRGPSPDVPSSVGSRDEAGTSGLPELTCHATMQNCDVKCLALVRSVSGDTVWTGERDGSVFVIDARTKQLLHQIQQEGTHVTCMTSDASHHMWVGFSDGRMRVWDTDRFDELGVLTDHPRGVTCLVFDPEGGHVYSGGDYRILKWDTHTLTPILKFAPHTSNIRAMVVDPYTLFSAGDDGTIRCWDAKTGACTEEWHGHKSSVRCLCRVDHLVWSGSEDRTVRIWNPETAECVKILRHKGPVQCIVETADKIWTGSTDKTIMVWHKTHFTLLDQKHDHTGYINCLCVVRRIEFFEVWSSATDRTIKIWNLETLPPESRDEREADNMVRSQALTIAQQGVKMEEVQGALSDSSKRQKQLEYQTEQLQSMLYGREQQYKADIQMLRQQVEDSHKQLNRLRRQEEGWLQGWSESAGDPQSSRTADSAWQTSGRKSSELGVTENSGDSPSPSDLRPLMAVTEERDELYGELRALQQEMSILRKEFSETRHEAAADANLIRDAKESLAKAMERVNTAGVGIRIDLSCLDPGDAVNVLVVSLLRGCSKDQSSSPDQSERYEPSTAMDEVISLREKVQSEEEKRKKAECEIKDRDFAISQLRAEMTKGKGSHAQEVALLRREVESLKAERATWSASSSSGDRPMPQSTDAGDAADLSTLANIRDILQCPRGTEHHRVQELVNCTQTESPRPKPGMGSGNDRASPCTDRQYRDLIEAYTTTERLNEQLMQMCERRAAQAEEDQTTIETLHEQLRSARQSPSGISSPSHVGISPSNSDPGSPAKKEALSKGTPTNLGPEQQFVQDSRTGLTRNVAALYDQVDRCDRRLAQLVHQVAKNPTLQRQDLHGELSTLRGKVAEVKENHRWLLANFLTPREKEGLTLPPDQFLPDPRTRQLAPQLFNDHT